MSGRRGRKRRTAPRELSGRAQRSPAPERTGEIVAVAEAQRRNMGAGDSWSDERWECPLGRLCIAGRLGKRGEDRYEAGKKWRAVVAEIRRVYGSPPPFPPSSDLSERIGRGGERPDISPERKAEITARYQDAFVALAGMGRRAQIAVNALVIQEQEISDDELPYACAGLDALALHYGLTGARKSA